jgi:hypothetical protein
MVSGLCGRFKTPLGATHHSVRGGTHTRAIGRGGVSTRPRVLSVCKEPQLGGNGGRGRPRRRRRAPATRRAAPAPAPARGLARRGAARPSARAERRDKLDQRRRDGLRCLHLAAGAHRHARRPVRSPLSHPRSLRGGSPVRAEESSLRQGLRGLLRRRDRPRRERQDRRHRAPPPPSRHSTYPRAAPPMHFSKDIRSSSARG